MASIFRRDDNYVEEPKRNTVDFSFQNNTTTDFGSLRPILCMPVIPGDSVRIKPTFGLKFMPMVFPVQTRMKASLHYFYVRNRNLWKDWTDFIGKTKEGLVPPYIHLTEQNRRQVETCQLGDFLGIPTELYGNVEKQILNSSSVSGYYDIEDGSFEIGNPVYTKQGLVSWDNRNYAYSNYQQDFSRYTGGDLPTGVYNAFQSVFILPAGSYEKLSLRLNFSKRELISSQSFISIYNADTGDYIYSTFLSVPSSESVFDIELPSNIVSDNAVNCVCNFITRVNFSASNLQSVVYSVEILDNIVEHKPVSEFDLSDLPWRSDSNPNGIPLSALPFRAEEAIYNVFYRNAENNPLMINGVPEYNKWNRTLDGGADTNFYPIHYHNWEDDFLTTAVPSPQQGNAPLVGISGTPTVTLAHDDGTTTTMTMEVDENGVVTAAHDIQGDVVTQAALMEAVNYGISINDFRNVNSFQRWLENNIRRGYKYKDQIKTHYGVSVRYDELDMPEFIGGTSQPVLVNQISQTVPTESSPLGDMAGQASAVGQGSEITHYCDEHGFIIGILCVKPVANYSQLLPKYFNVTDTFDYYFPEFGHIGMQPITYAEVTPLQANLEGKLNDVFGYQRAWYDLIAKTDEVHGLFRSDLRNFLINRTFDGTPELGKEFTVIDPKQINDVFAYTDKTDKIIGQIYMDISKKTPVPLYGIPKLE